MSNRYPDFLVIGAMRAGSTTLYQHLRRFDGVYMSTPKEIDFFSMDAVFERGPNWYCDHFAAARADQICGEVSPSYSRYPRFPDSVRRIADTLPCVKLVYILRHPVERLYSNYVRERSRGFVNSLDEMFRDRPWVLETSRYMTQIDRYLKRFSRHQMHIVLLDDLTREPTDTLHQLLSFLGVASREQAAVVAIQENVGGKNYVERKSNAFLRVARSVPGMKVVSSAIPPTMREKTRQYITAGFPKSKLGAWIARRHVSKVEPLDVEMRARMLALLDESTSRLEAFLDRDLSAWRV